MNRHAVALALLSAALLGMSTPATKLFIGTLEPAILAGLLYWGAGPGDPPGEPTSTSVAADVCLSDFSISVWNGPASAL